MRRMVRGIRRSPQTKWFGGFQSVQSKLFKGTKRAFDDLGADMELGIDTQAVDESLLAILTRGPTGRDPDQSAQIVSAGVRPGPAILQLDHRLLRTLRDEAVPAPDQVHGDLAMVEVAPNGCLKLIPVQRERAFGENAMAHFQELAA